MRVLVGMSGGVDSSVAAARLLDAGHEVAGVHLAMARTAPGGGARGCAVPVAVEDAQRVCDLLGIELMVWDFGPEFRANVIDYFEEEYRAGRTPNPCLRCNATIKFSAMLERARAMGFDAIATGHYATLEPDGSGGVRLRRGTDETKDQSYVVGVLTQEQLRHVVFPLAGAKKPDVRAEAARRGLPVANKPDSLDICFIPQGSAAQYLRKALGEEPGEIVDESGEVVGEHLGYHQFTIGQRKGLHLGRPAADGAPRFVLKIEPAQNRVVVGPKQSLLVRTMACIRPTWAEVPRTGSWSGLVQVRAHGAAMPAVMTVTEDGVEVVLDEPAYGIAPGQGAVFYEGDYVVGSATIDRTGA